MEDSQILEQLYTKEQMLENQLNATRQAIIGFGGRVKSGEAIKPIVAEEVPVKSEPVKEKSKPEVVEIKPTRNSREEVYGYMAEVFKEVGVPINVNIMQSKLAQLGIQYTVPVLAGYLSTMVKDGKALRIDRGKYAHLDYRHPEALKKKVVSIVEVEQYCKLRKEVTRTELLDVFVKGGRMSEAMVQLRIEKLITDKKMTRKERGVYKWKG